MTKPLYMSQKEISIVITMCKMYYFNFMIIIIIIFIYLFDFQFLKWLIIYERLIWKTTDS